MWLSSSNMVSAWIFWMALWQMLIWLVEIIGISRFTGSSLKRAGAPTSLQACRWSSWRIWQLPQFPLHFSFLFVSCWCRAQEGAGWSCHEHIRHHLATRFFFSCAFLKEKQLVIFLDIDDLVGSFSAEQIGWLGDFWTSRSIGFVLLPNCPLAEENKWVRKRHQIS